MITPSSKPLIHTHYPVLSPGVDHAQQFRPECQETAQEEYVSSL